MNILVLCTGNSARSILLECLLTCLGEGRVVAYSAGSKPSGKVHPQSLSLLEAEGFDVTGLRSKSWDEYTGDDTVMDIVITVCGSAAAETCPMWPGTPLRAHWGVEDPAVATETTRPAAFREAYAILRRRATAFLEAPFETMDRKALQELLTVCADID